MNSRQQVFGPEYAQELCVLHIRGVVCLGRSFNEPVNCRWDVDSIDRVVTHPAWTTQHGLRRLNFGIHPIALECQESPPITQATFDISSVSISPSGLCGAVSSAPSAAGPGAMGRQQDSDFMAAARQAKDAATKTCCRLNVAARPPPSPLPLRAVTLARFFRMQEGWTAADGCLSARGAIPGHGCCLDGRLCCWAGDRAGEPQRSPPLCSALILAKQHPYARDAPTCLRAKPGLNSPTVFIPGFQPDARVLQRVVTADVVGPVEVLAQLPMPGSLVVAGGGHGNAGILRDSGGWPRWRAARRGPGLGGGGPGGHQVPHIL